MSSKFHVQILFALSLVLMLAVSAWGQESGSIQDYTFQYPENSLTSISVMPQEFKGYTDHWARSAWTWYRHAGLFAVTQRDIRSDLWQWQEDIGNQMMLEELWIQKGFVNRLARKTVREFRSPSTEELARIAGKEDALIIGIDRDPVMKDLLAKLPEEFQFRRNRAFFLEGKGHTLFVISTQSRAEAERLSGHVAKACEVINKYSLYKGMPGVSVSYFTITQNWSNPLEVIDRALALRCSWLMVEGYDDWMIPALIQKWMKGLDFPFEFISGQSGQGCVMYGMERYPQIQDNTTEECLAWTRKNGGYIFRSSFRSQEGSAEGFDGVVIRGGGPVRGFRNQEQSEEPEGPFVTGAGSISSRIPPSMVLFLDKGESLNKESIFRAILDRRAVGIFDAGALVGPPELKQVLNILLLEEEYLDAAFLEMADVSAAVRDERLLVTLRNKSGSALRGSLRFEISPNLRLGENLRVLPAEIMPGETRQLEFPIHYSAEASGNMNPIGVIFETGAAHIRALTYIEIPRAVEIHPLLTDIPGTVEYPVTLWNISDRDAIDAQLEVLSGTGNRSVATQTITLNARHGAKAKGSFSPKLGAGEYTFRVSALGKSVDGKVVISERSGDVSAREEDTDGDGIPEIILENKNVRATILLFGGRVIEYFLKAKNENLLFKLWPEKPPWAGEPRGYRAFYPWGGLEEFLGYPYIGGQIVYKYEIEKASGTHARVRVWTNVHGSKIEKIMTLYGGDPLLEVRYEFDDIDSNINIVGINPLVQIGPSTGPEDVYHFPMDSIVTRSPKLEDYYGSVFELHEGWVAGQDTSMNVSLVVGYPVNDALFMHLWNNHPHNTPTPYFYTELQPWVMLKPGTTTYFTYYLYGKDGGWEPALGEFRDLGLISKRTVAGH